MAKTVSTHVRYNCNSVLQLYPLNAFQTAFRVFREKPFLMNNCLKWKTKLWELIKVDVIYLNFAFLTRNNVKEVLF
jgi:hypothetical protein